MTNNPHHCTNGGLVADIATRRRQRQLIDEHGHEYDADLLDIINEYHNK